MISSFNYFDFPIVVVGFEAVKITNSKTNMYTLASGFASCQLDDLQVVHSLGSASSATRHWQFIVSVSKGTLRSICHNYYVPVN